MTFQLNVSKISYTRSTQPAGLTEEQAEPLREALRRWDQRHRHSALNAREIDGVLVVRDRRSGWPPADYVLDDPREIAAWRLLEHGRSPQALHRRLADAGTPWAEPDLHAWLNDLRSHGLVFREGGQWVTLPTTPAAVFGHTDPPSVIPLAVSAIPATKATA
jgi:hypothetical protein